MDTSTDPAPSSPRGSAGVVVDCSLFLPLYLEDEKSAAVERFFAALSRLDFWVPWLWRPEFINALDVAQRRGRMSAAKHRAAIEHATTLPLRFDDRQLPLGELAKLSAEHELSAYDAIYLELARRRKLPLATLDEDLRRAALAAGVKLYRID